MKTICFTGLLLFSGLLAQAQSKLKFGLQAGVLANDHYSKSRFDIATVGPGPATPAYYANTQYPLPGYLVGITLQRGLTNRLAVGVNFSWYQSTSVEKGEFIIQSNNTDQITRSRYRNQYIQVPVWLQYTQTTLGLKPYARLGLAYTHLLNAHLTTKFTDNRSTTSDGYTQVIEEDLPISYQNYVGFPRHDWQVMTEVGLSVSKHLKLGIRYDLLGRERSFIGAADGYYSFRNRNVGLVTEIMF